MSVLLLYVLVLHLFYRLYSLIITVNELVDVIEHLECLVDKEK
jgi:hypothetical protein